MVYLFVVVMLGQHVVLCFQDNGIDVIELTENQEEESKPSPEKEIEDTDEFFLSLTHFRFTEMTNFEWAQAPRIGSIGNVTTVDTPPPKIS